MELTINILIINSLISSYCILVIVFSFYAFVRYMCRLLMNVLVLYHCM